MNIIGIIPARYSSSRFPGKLLKTLDEKTVLWHTYNSALKSKLIGNLFIAAGDNKIFEYCKSENIPVEKTPSKLKSGTERCIYIASKTAGADIIVNIQGDEPFISGKDIDRAIKPLISNRTTDITTLASRIENAKELNDPNVVKVVFDKNKFSLYFSRSIIPYRMEGTVVSHYKHIGLYAFRKKTLFELKKLNREHSILAASEKLEQLDWLYSGYRIKVVIVSYRGIGVDTIEDLKKARKLVTAQPI